MNEIATNGYCVCDWQDLADHLPPCEAVSARSVSRKTLCGGSGLGAERPLIRGGLTGPDAEQGGCHQKRKAAHGRVAHHDGPGRKRQGHCHRHGPHTDHCGNQNHPCHHLTHPLCGVCCQGVGAPWQDYVHELENLRRLQIADLAHIATAGIVPGLASITRAGGGRVRLQVEARRYCGRVEVKLLASQGNSYSPGPPARCLSPGGGGRIRGRPAGAATCRKAKALSWQTNSEVAEECLSFVIPGQQGGPGNRGEVH